MKDIIIKRAGMDRMTAFMGNDLVKIVSGLRRSGKSVLMDLLRKELGKRRISPRRIFSYNFEDLDLLGLANAKALHDEISSRIKKVRGKTFIFLDEIQEVEDWEKCVNSLRAKFDCEIFLTGSNSKLLSGELSTHLSGRYVQFRIYPFSFKEFLAFDDSSSPKQAFERYLEFGGMPYLPRLGYDKSLCRYYLNDLFDSIILKDIVRRHSIRDVDLLRRVLTFTLANAGTTFSANSIVKYLKGEHRKASLDTVVDYLDYCQEAFLLYKVPREEVASKRLLTVQEKYYVVDVGLINAALPGISRSKGLMLENIVCMELLRRGYTLSVGRLGDKEIDFIAERNGEKTYIQVTYLLATDEIVEREFAPLEALQNSSRRLLLSMDELNFSRPGIPHRNIVDWLLEE